MPDERRSAVAPPRIDYRSRPCS